MRILLYRNGWLHLCSMCCLFFGWFSSGKWGRFFTQTNIDWLTKRRKKSGNIQLASLNYYLDCLKKCALFIVTWTVYRYFVKRHIYLLPNRLCHHTFIEEVIIMRMYSDSLSIQFSPQIFERIHQMGINEEEKCKIWVNFTNHFF